MNKLNLNAIGVMELNQQELLNVVGGGFWGDVWNGICAVGEAIADAAVWLWEHLVPYTGDGVGATVGVPI